MNVISNNCAGSYFMTNGTEKLGNPFSWAIVTYSSIDAILTHFYDINWSNISINESTRWKGTYFITVDNLFDIHYIHYHFNPENQVPVIHGHDISSCDIWEYIVSKYITRVKRMVRIHDIPKFLIVEDNSSGTREEYLDLYNRHADSPFKICWCAYDETNTSYRPNLIKIGQKKLPKPIVDEYYSKIANCFI